MKESELKLIILSFKSNMNISWFSFSKSLHQSHHEYALGSIPHNLDRFANCQMN